MAQNLWRVLAQKITEGGGALFSFLIGLSMLLIGMSLTIEDFRSTQAGLLDLQEAYSLQVVSGGDFLWMDALFWMSAFFWIGQIGFVTIWSLDMDSRWRRWSLWFAALFLLCDFVSDVQYRSAGIFLNMDTGITLNGTVGVSSVLTLLFFTLGSEVFVTAGSAMAFVLFEPAITELFKQIAGVFRAWRKARGYLDQVRNEGKPQPRPGGGNKPQKPQNNRPGVNLPPDLTDLLPDFSPPIGSSGPQPPRHGGKGGR